MLRLILAFSFCWVQAISAGEIHLNNGDKLSGEVAAIGKSSITWRSPVLGDIKIAKSKIQGVETSKALKVPGNKAPCYWVKLEAENVTLQCQERVQMLVSLLTLEEVVTYDKYLENGHSFGGKLLIQGSQSKGNVDANDWLVSNKVSIDTGDIDHTLDIIHTSRSVEQTSSNQNQNSAIELFSGVYRLGWKVLPKWFVFGDLAAKKDDAKKIKERYDLGMGIGYKLWEREKSSLSFESGAQHTSEHLVSSQPQTNRNSTERASWRIANIFSYKITDDVSIKQRNEFLRSLTSSGDWEAESVTSLVMPIILGISADFTLKYDFDSTPSTVEQIEDDVVFRVGLGYEW